MKPFNEYKAKEFAETFTGETIVINSEDMKLEGTVVGYFNDTPDNWLLVGVDQQPTTYSFEFKLDGMGSKAILLKPAIRLVWINFHQNWRHMFIITKPYKHLIESTNIPTYWNF